MSITTKSVSIINTHMGHYRWLVNDQEIHPTVSPSEPVTICRADGNYFVVADGHFLEPVNQDSELNFLFKLASHTRDEWKTEVDDDIHNYASLVLDIIEWAENPITCAMIEPNIVRDRMTGLFRTMDDTIYRLEVIYEMAGCPNDLLNRFDWENTNTLDRLSDCIDHI